MTRRLSFVALLVLICSCAGDEGTSAADCEPEQTRLCRTQSGCLGQAVCTGDPPEWQPCECPDEANAELLSNVGAACTRKDQCAEADLCLKADDAFLGGALVSGTCVRDCSQDPNICSRLSYPAVCVKASTGELSQESMADEGEAYCFQSCDLGTEDESRCRGRDDVACSGLEEGPAFCRPLCVSDDDCPGRFCDPLLGVCVADSPAGKTLGQTCAFESENPGCEGVCLDVNAVNFCSGRCIYGSAADCGDRDLGRPGLCFLPEDEGSIGDVGFCALLCDCNQQCPNPDMICDPFLDQPLEELLGAKGVCLPREEAPDAGVDSGTPVPAGIPCPLQ